MRAVRELHPCAVLLENVGGLLREAFRPYFEYILRQLESPTIKPSHRELWQTHDERIRRQQRSIGYEPEYHVTWRLLEAADYGAPQNRKRVIIVATRADIPIYQFPTRTHSRDALMRDQRTGSYWERHDIPKPDKLPGNGSAYNPEDSCLPWITIRDALTGLPPASATAADAVMNHWLIPGAREYTGHAGSLLDWPSKTIKAGVHGVPGGENTYIADDGKLYYLTLRESARIQTFPDTHYFTGARIHVTRQIGNAVPCVLAKAVTEPLYEILVNAIPMEAMR